MSNPKMTWTFYSHYNFLIKRQLLGPLPLLRNAQSIVQDELIIVRPTVYNPCLDVPLYFDVAMGHLIREIYVSKSLLLGVKTKQTWESTVNQSAETGIAGAALCFLSLLLSPQNLSDVLLFRKENQRREEEEVLFLLPWQDLVKQVGISFLFLFPFLSLSKPVFWMLSFL